MALQVWLPLNGNLDNLGLSNILFTMSGSGVVTDSSGKIGSCYKRASIQSGGRISSNTTINLNGSISMFCWAKVTECATSSANGLVSNHSHANKSGFGITVKKVSATDFRISCSTGNGSNRTFNTYYGTTNIKDKWCHLGLTYDRTTNILKLWVNGSCEYTRTYTNSSRADYIWIFDWSTTYNFNYYLPACSINDVRIYDHCLSPKEVKEISKGLVLHYKLDGNDISITIPRNGGLIPDGIELYDYILSSGTLWIDTGVTLSLTNKFEFETDFTYSPANNRPCPFYGTENYLTGFMAQYHYTNNNLYAVYIKGALFGGSNISITASSRMYSKTVIDVPNKTWATIYNTTSTNGTYSNLITDTTSTVKFFGNDLYNKYIAKCYYFKIKRNDLLIRNFLPCTYLGEPGMWDTVENKFYKNQGTGLFILGNKITILYDSSGYCNNGMIVGNVSIDLDTPRYNKSLVIQSSSTITHQNTLSNDEQEWTCCAWIKPLSLPDHSNLNNFNIGNRLRQGTYPLLYINNGTNDFYTYGNKAIVTDEWQHVAFVFKNETVSGSGTTSDAIKLIYINGVNQTGKGKNKTNTPFGIPDNVILFGGDFSGNVSDYREYCTALSEEDILELYNTSAYVDNKQNMGCFEIREDTITEAQITKQGLIECNILTEETEASIDGNGNIECNQLIEI